jgi:alanine racemase
MKLKEKGQRLLAEINLDNIVYNYRQVLKCAPGCRVCCVIKADAYGHGAVPVARALAAAGAGFFAVAAPEEALQLRRHGITEEILLFGPVDSSWVKPLVEQGITLTVTDRHGAQEYIAAAPGLSLKVHIKLETGMARLGLPYLSAAEEILALAALPELKIEGLYTNFSASDMEEENTFSTLQMTRFQAVADKLRQGGLNVPLLHCAGSAAIIAHPFTHAMMVRPGLMLFGSSSLNPHPPLKPALTLRARVMQVLEVKQGESVGYGRAWYAPRDTLIATISIGYADGLTRLLSGKLPLLIQGQEARQVGRICMDMCMLDVTDIPGIKAGDYATVIGEDGEAAITVDQLAKMAGTIPHEIFCALGLRAPRFYYQNGQLAKDINYIDRL